MMTDPEPRKRLEEIDEELEAAMQNLSDTNERIDSVIFELENPDTDDDNDADE